MTNQNEQSKMRPFLQIDRETYYRCSHTTEALLLGIVTEYGRSADGAYLSAGKMAKLIGKSRISVERALKSMVRKGILKKEGRNGRPSIYRLTFNPTRNTCCKNDTGNDRNVTGVMQKCNNRCSEDVTTGCVKNATQINMYSNNIELNNNERENNTPARPTFQEVKDFAEKNGTPMTDEQVNNYLYHRKSIGWMKSGNPIVDYEADVRCWMSNESRFEARNNRQQCDSTHFSSQPGPNERGYDPDADRKAKEFLDKLGILPATTKKG